MSKKYVPSTCREFAKRHRIDIVGKLKRVPNSMKDDFRIFIDDAENEFWVSADGKEIVYVYSDGGFLSGYTEEKE